MMSGVEAGRVGRTNADADGGCENGEIAEGEVENAEDVADVAVRKDDDEAPDMGPALDG